MPAKRGKGKKDVGRGLKTVRSVPLIDVSALVKACKLGSRFASADALCGLDTDTDESLDDFEASVSVVDDDEAETEEVVFNFILPFCASPQRRFRQRDRCAESLRPLIPPPVGESRLCVVFDLDETLVFARNGPVIIRPFLQELLQTVQNLQCEIVLWTAGVPSYVTNILRGIELATGFRKWYHHVITRGKRWWKEGHPNPKDLQHLGRDPARVILIDNNPACGQLQPESTVLVQDFDKIEDDETLRVVACLLDQVVCEVTRGRSVQESLASSLLLCPLAFDLSPEHIVGNVVRRITATGLKYSPGLRTYAGEQPV